MNPRVLRSSRHARSVLRTQTDGRLADLARRGSEPAFEAIVARYRRVMVARCRRIVGDSDAEEAVQVALVRAHAALRRGDEVTNLGAWLQAIATNASLNVLRARRARPECPDPDHEPADAGDDVADRRQRFRDVIDAVRALPPRQRDAIVLRELEGLSYEQIGERIGASSGAVRQLLNRARRGVRERVGAFTGAEPVIRWLLDGGGGAAGRLGALGCGGTVAAKLCAAALVPATVLAPPALAPARPHRVHRARTVAAHAAPSNREARQPAAPDPPALHLTAPNPEAIDPAHTRAALRRHEGLAPHSLPTAAPKRRPARSTAPAPANSVGAIIVANAEQGARPSEDARRGAGGIR